MVKKENKSLSILKKGFKKNEIVIYAIALMLVTAGYFNYTANLDNNSQETYSENIAKEETTQKTENTNTSEIVEKDKTNKPSQESTNANGNINETGETSNNKNTDKTEETSNNENTSETKETSSSHEDDNEIGDAKLVNSDSVTSDYFSATKLERDTNYADMITAYTKILEDASVSETQKTIAMNEITKINNIKNAISVSENLLSTKGFENYVVLVNGDSINVVVKSSEKLTPEKVAQIQNIISREFDAEIVNIHITEKN